MNIWKSNWKTKRQRIMKHKMYDLLLYINKEKNGFVAKEPFFWYENMYFIFRSI